MKNILQIQPGTVATGQFKEFILKGNIGKRDPSLVC